MPPIKNCLIKFFLYYFLIFLKFYFKKFLLTFFFPFLPLFFFFFPLYCPNMVLYYSKLLFFIAYFWVSLLKKTIFFNKFHISIFVFHFVFLYCTFDNIIFILSFCNICFLIFCYSFYIFKSLIFSTHFHLQICLLVWLLSPLLALPFLLLVTSFFFLPLLFSI